jgi:hypothetical protein
MKSMPPPSKKQTLKLKVDNNIHFRLLGISCHENDYRLVWAINTQLKWNFVKTANLVIHNQKLKSDLEFSRFTFSDENRYITYHLISNICPDGFLFSEIKNIDFLLQVNGEITEAEMREFRSKLKAVKVISATFILHPEKLKGLNQILDT